MLYPDNFLYFITLFVVAIFSGTHLLFSYTRNKLLIINVFIFVFCAIRACTEYYLPQVESFDVATRIAIFHGSVTTLIAHLFYFCIWFYIRPFKGWSYEKIINRLYFWLIVVLLFVLNLIPLISRKMYYFHEEKINGYWQFAVNEDYFLTSPFLLKSQILPALMALIFLWSIIRDKQERIQKSLLLVSWVVMPYLYFQFLEISGEWNIPSIAGIYIIHSLIISWFVSGYRLFTDGFTEAKNDLLNSVSDLAISVNLQHIITSANEKAKTLFSIQQQSLSQLLTSYSTLTAQQIDQKLQVLFFHQTTSTTFTLQFENQVERVFEAKIAPIKINKRSKGYTFLLTDLTELKKKEQELEHLNYTKDQLLAIIGQNLRQPALAFRGISKKLNDLVQQRAFEQVNRMGQQLEKAAFRLSSLLDNLLTWTLLQRHLLSYHPQKVELWKLTEEICHVYKQLSVQKDIDFQVDIPEDLSVYCDIKTFETLLQNLLDNALKFTPVAGEIRLSAVGEADKIQLVVEDTGIGIRPAKLATLFDTKSQKRLTSSSLEYRQEIGLTLVKSLVNLNQGQLKVVSTVNQGTRFEIWLPA